MRIALTIIVTIASLFQGVLGGSSTETESVPVPVPSPPAPAPAPQCPECAGAQGIICAAPGTCLCGDVLVPGTEKTCSFDSCCAQPSTCCDSATADAYACLNTGAPFCVDGLTGQVPPNKIFDYFGIPTTDFTFSNLDQCCPSGTFSDGGRRSLNEVADLVLSEEEIMAHELMDACEEETFETFLHIDNTHFSAIVSPSEEAQAAGCPFLLVTSDFGPDRPANKKVWGWLNKEQGEVLFPVEKKLYIGTFKGDNLKDAFRAASPSNHGSYDFLTNNCADFMLNLASELGVKIDKNIIGFTTRRLLEDKASGLMDKIKDSASYFSFFGERHLRGDEDEIVATLVGKRAGLE